MGDNCVRNSRIKILKPHAHLHITGRQSTKFQVHPVKDVHLGGVAETRSLGRKDGLKDGRTDGRNNAYMGGRGLFLEPPPPTSGDNE